jgi:hypothetical protein
MISSIELFAFIVVHQQKCSECCLFVCADSNATQLFFDLLLLTDDNSGAGAGAVVGGLVAGPLGAVLGAAIGKNAGANKAKDVAGIDPLLEDVDSEIGVIKANYEVAILLNSRRCEASELTVGTGVDKQTSHSSVQRVRTPASHSLLCEFAAQCARHSTVRPSL